MARYTKLEFVTRLLFLLCLAFAQTSQSAQTGCIGNRVWFDENQDGVQQYSEDGVSSVEVALIDATGVEIDSSLTQSKGYFSVCGPVGQAMLKIRMPEGFAATLPGVGPSRNLDSNIDTSGVTDVLILRNKNISHVDAGLIMHKIDSSQTTSNNESSVAEVIDPDTYDSGCVGNRVWFDENRDGLQQPGENGIANVEVTLFDGYGVEIDSVHTQSKGYFNICGPVGSATLKIGTPDGFIATSTAVGSSKNLDSDVDDSGEVNVLIVKNKKISHVDAGYVTQESQDNENITDIDNVVAEATSTDPEFIGDETHEELSTPDLGSANGEFRYGVWIEPRNAMPETVDPGVTPAFPLFDFAHVRGKSLSAVGNNPENPEYVVNILKAARSTNTALDLQLGSSGDYGWNFATGRGNFSLQRWKDAISNFANDPASDAAIHAALNDGTIRYIFLIDEPHHSRWSPSWNGLHASSGNINHVTNLDLDEMAAHVKSLWGEGVQSIVRAAPVRLIQGGRGGMFTFQHLTHAYISPGPKKWLPGNTGPGKGFEWWLRQKNNHTGKVTNCSSFGATGLKMAVMLQWGFESRGNPYNGIANWKNDWWAGDVKYPYSGKTSYVKAAPLEMDFILKHFLVPRNPATCEIDTEGEVLVDTIVSFRWDRSPTDNGKMPMSTYPHYLEFHDRLLDDLRSGNNVPLIGLPLGIGAL